MSSLVSTCPLIGSAGLGCHKFSIDGLDPAYRNLMNIRECMSSFIADNREIGGHSFSLISLIIDTAV